MNFLESIIQENCYLYSFWSGQLKVYKGSVCRVVQSERQGRFLAFDVNKAFQCSVEALEVFNSVIWLPERNDALAKELLVAYEELSLLALQEKRDNCLNKIKHIQEAEPHFVEKATTLN